MELLLYFSPGSCARVPLILLEEIGVPFQARLVAFMKGEHKTPEYLERVKEIALAAMAGQLAPLERRLEDQDWVLGDIWSSLDAYLDWVWFRSIGAGFDAAPFPNVAAHHARMDARPAVERALVREAEAQADLEARGLAFAFPPSGGR